MEFSAFTKEVAKELRIRTAGKYKIRLNDVQKNNGMTLTGILIMENDSNVTPTIYLNQYYQSYEDLEINMDEILDSILDVYEKNKISRSVDMRFFKDYEKVKNRIIFKLINYDMNKELLSDTPHIKYLDMAIVFQCLVSAEFSGNATVLIRDSHLQIWNVTTEDIYKYAMKNTPVLLPAELSSMEDVIRTLAGTEDLPDECFHEQIPMYVLSNTIQVCGASCILYPDVLKDFATAVGGDYYVLPSSVHECLFLPVQGKDGESEMLKYMVSDINRTKVDMEERLSDSVYLYRKEIGMLEIA